MWKPAKQWVQTVRVCVKSVCCAHQNETFQSMASNLTWKKAWCFMAVLCYIWGFKPTFSIHHQLHRNNNNSPLWVWFIYSSSFSLGLQALEFRRQHLVLFMSALKSQFKKKFTIWVKEHKPVFLLAKKYTGLSFWCALWWAAIRIPALWLRNTCTICTLDLYQLPDSCAAGG